MSLTKGTKRSKVTKTVIFVFFASFALFAVQTGAFVEAQLPPARLSFEVASVKPSPDPRSGPVFTPVVNQIQPGGVWRSRFATVL